MPEATKDLSRNYPGRASHHVWVSLDDGSPPRYSQGFECEGSDYLWFPRLAVSTSRYFDSPEAAKLAALQALSVQMSRLRDRERVLIAWTP